MWRFEGNFDHFRFVLDLVEVWTKSNFEMFQQGRSSNWTEWSTIQGVFTIGRARG